MENSINLFLSKQVTLPYNVQKEQELHLFREKELFFDKEVTLKRD